MFTESILSISNICALVFHVRLVFLWIAHTLAPMNDCTNSYSFLGNCKLWRLCVIISISELKAKENPLNFPHCLVSTGRRTLSKGI